MSQPRHLRFQIPTPAADFVVPISGTVNVTNDSIIVPMVRGEKTSLLSASATIQPSDASGKLLLEQVNLVCRFLSNAAVPLLGPTIPVAPTIIKQLLPPLATGSFNVAFFGDWDVGTMSEVVGNGAVAAVQIRVAATMTNTDGVAPHNFKMAGAVSWRFTPVAVGSEDF